MATKGHSFLLSFRPLSLMFIGSVGEREPTGSTSACKEASPQMVWNNTLLSMVRTQSHSHMQLYVKLGNKVPETNREQQRTEIWMDDWLPVSATTYILYDSANSPMRILKK